MKQFEYIQLVQVAQEFDKFPVELLYVFTELITYHKKYQDELEYFLIYPNMNKNDGFKKARSHAEDIVSLCKTHGIKWEFEKVNIEDWVEFKNKFSKSRQFVKYFFQGFDITKFIVFIKPKKADELVEDNPEISANDLDFGEEEKE